MHCEGRRTILHRNCTTSSPYKGVDTSFFTYKFPYPESIQIQIQINALSFLFIAKHLLTNKVIVLNHTFQFSTVANFSSKAYYHNHINLMRSCFSVILLGLLLVSGVYSEDSNRENYLEQPDNSEQTKRNIEYKPETKESPPEFIEKSAHKPKGKEVQDDRRREIEWDETPNKPEPTTKIQLNKSIDGYQGDSKQKPQQHDDLEHNILIDPEIEASIHIDPQLLNQPNAEEAEKYRQTHPKIENSKEVSQNQQPQKLIEDTPRSQLPTLGLITAWEPFDTGSDQGKRVDGFIRKENPQLGDAVLAKSQILNSSGVRYDFYYETDQANYKVRVLKTFEGELEMLYISKLKKKSSESGNNR